MQRETEINLLSPRRAWELQLYQWWTCMHDKGHLTWLQVSTAEEQSRIQGENKGAWIRQSINPQESTFCMFCVLYRPVCTHVVNASVTVITTWLNKAPVHVTVCFTRLLSSSSPKRISGCTPCMRQEQQATLTTITNSSTAWSSFLRRMTYHVFDGVLYKHPISC